MEMKFEFVDSRVFLGRVFRLIFRSRGSEIVDEVLSCSVRFFLFFFLYISSVAAIIETIETSVVKYFHE